MRGSCDFWKLWARASPLHCTCRSPAKQRCACMAIFILQQAQQQASPILLVILGVRRAGAVVGYQGELQSPDLLKDVLLRPVAARNCSDTHAIGIHPARHPMALHHRLGPDRPWTAQYPTLLSPQHVTNFTASSVSFACATTRAHMQVVWDAGADALGFVLRLGRQAVRPHPAWASRTHERGHQSALKLL